MKNLETPKTKLALYGLPSSLGNALLVESLGRQYETSLILADLNAITARPGIRTKQGDLADALTVSRSIAGMDGVVCLLDSALGRADDAAEEARRAEGFNHVFTPISALLDGLAIAGVPRLLLVADFTWLERVDSSPEVHLQQRLVDSPVRWTLIDAPRAQRADIGFEEFLHPADPLNPGEVHTLRRFAAGLLDEFELSHHVRQRIRLTDRAEVPS